MLRFFLFVASMMVSCTSSAWGWGVSPCPVDTIPIQIVNEVKSRPVTTLSEARISNTYPHFRSFVTDVTKHIAARLSKENLCIDSADSQKQSLLQFVHWYVSTSGNEPLGPVPSLGATRPSKGCRISSPWIDLTIERGPVPWVRGVVRWNQRQLLVDQAMLAGARNMPKGLAMPLKSREFNQFALDYADTEILRQPAVKPVEERIPPELLWLFRRAWQSTLASFGSGAQNSMEKAMEKGAESYTKLVIALVDRCFDSDGADIQYNNILDVAGLISLEQYKIDTPIR
ncbi:hypothetical protein JBO49_16110 [Serratia fonticola]|uniref:hypothetical protein n=1 Tax=Serratia fonticola TaxID=47917 RepID=UPI00192C1CDF|nr:hypothetical protein [Serratia fonticola]MBL5862142.1 hypothetical protein [Serratia fonticola]